MCCAAGLAALEFLIEENLIDHVAQKEKLFRSLLVHDKIKSFRAEGLLMSLEFESYSTNKQIIDLCISKGVFTDWFLFASHCMRLAPPLIISEAEIKQACNIIIEACNES